jgi:transcriptional regulator with XRE-family HTH domain
MDIYKERILPLFQSSGISDAELERKIGIKPKKINDWNAGRTKSYEKYIPQIAAFFNVSTDYLLGNTDDPQPAGQPPSEDIKLSPQEQRLIEMYRELNDEGQDVVTSFLDTMLMSGKYKKYNKLNLGTKEA